VLKLNFPLVMAHVKSRYENSTWALVQELDVRFPNHELMSTLGATYLKLAEWQEWFPLVFDCDQGCLLQQTKSGKGWDVDGCFAWSIRWICSLHFLRWPWLQTMSRCWKRCWEKTRSIDCGQRLLLFPSSKSKFQNSLSWFS